MDKLLSLCIFTFSIPSPIFLLESVILDKKLIFSNTSFVMLEFFFKLSERVRGSNLVHITDTKRSSFIFCCCCCCCCDHCYKHYHSPLKQTLQRPNQQQIKLICLVLTMRMKMMKVICSVESLWQKNLLRPPQRKRCVQNSKSLFLFQHVSVFKLPGSSSS